MVCEVMNSRQEVKMFCGGDGTHKTEDVFTVW